MKEEPKDFDLTGIHVLLAEDNVLNAEIALELPYFTEDYKEPDERKICLGISRQMLNALMEEDYLKVSELRRSRQEESCPAGAYIGVDGIYIR